MNMVLQVHPCCCKWQNLVLSLRVNSIAYTEYYIPYFLYPFISWWTLSLIPYLDYCDSATINMRSADVSSHTNFISFGVRTSYDIGRSNGSSVLNILRNLDVLFHNDCTNLHSHQPKIHMEPQKTPNNQINCEQRELI
jgi:hypothetical protein